MQAFPTVISPDVVDVLRHEHEQIRQLCTDVQSAGRDRRKSPLAALQQAVHRHYFGEIAVAHPATCDGGPNRNAIARTCQAKGEPSNDRSPRSAGSASSTLTSTPDSRPSPAPSSTPPPVGNETSFRYCAGARPQRLHMIASTMHDIRIMALD